MRTKNILGSKVKYLITLLLIATSAQAGLTQLANIPLSGASSVEISPNIMFVLDDSGSMSWDYLPDWAGLTTQLSQSKNPSFNGVAYNPAVTYTPPKYFNTDGTPNTTTYLGQNATNSTNWTAVRDDGFGIQATPATKTSNLVGNAFYYTSVAGEYCTNASMKTCIAASAPSAAYPIAAKLRWCKTAAEAVAATPSAGACQATQIDPVPAPPATATNIPFNYPRMPAPRTSTITISGSGSTSVSSITVDSKIILSSSIAATTDPVALAASIETSINACTFGKTGACQIEGYSAIASGNTVTISAPGVTTLTPAISKSGSMTMTSSAFARPATNLAPGENLLTVITSTTTTYPKGSNRSDCLLAATTCSYAEEMTNYANWWAYYRTRMQTMKTATSLSFETIGTKFRVGYMSINNNTSLDFQNIASFDASQKKAWYDKIFSARPNNNTPLRVALSNAGRLYAGRLNNLTFNGVTVVDPVQYFCQKNVTILSTDGYWNEGAGFMWNGSTAVGDQDGPGLESRPQLDGGGPQDQKSTSQITKTLTPTTATQAQIKTAQLQSITPVQEIRTLTQKQTSTNQLQSRDAQMQSRTSQLQKRTFSQGQVQTKTQWQEQTSNLQSRTGPLQQRTSNLQTRTKTQAQISTSQLQSRTVQWQSKTYQLQEKVTQVQQKTSSNGGTTWTSWTNVASCSPVTSGTNRSQCQTLAQGAWTDTSSCTAVTGGTTVTNPGTDSEVTTYTTARSCQYTTPPSWVNVGSCTVVNKSSGSPYTVGTAVDCQTAWNAWEDATSCTTSSSVQCQYTDWTGYTDTPSCSTLAKSNSSPYTVGVARQCRNDWTIWADTASTCTSSATVGCQYGNFTNWTAASDATCSPVTPSGSSPYTVTTQKECRVNYGSWGNVLSNCNVVSSGATQTQCRYTDWSDWGNVATCTGATQSTGPTSYTTTRARNCQQVFTGWTDTVAACVPSATVNCQTVWTPWTNVPSCNYVAGSSECQYTAWTGWANTASCTSIPQSSSPNYTVNIATDCQTTWPNPWVNAVSCTSSSTRECQYAGWTGWTDTATCSAQTPSAASPYSVGLATQCQTSWTNYATTASCTEASGVQCRTTWSNPWVNTASCEEGPYRMCRNLPVIDTWTNTASCTAGTVAGLTTSCQYLIPPPTSQYVASCDEEVAGQGNGYIATTCSTATTGPTDVASCDEEPATSANSYVKTTCNVLAKGPTADTLADVAEYYWKTDLRDPLLLPDRCTGGPIVSAGVTTYSNVCINDPEKYPKQYMTTYTLGLGASGLMEYQSDYLTSVLGDFFSVKNGLTADPSTGVCSWQKNGVCNWPKPESNAQTNIDDLWHAAVNGRGTYFSAGNPTSLAAGISGALAAIEIKDGALAAVSVTSPNLVASGNAVFEVSFTAGDWTGNLIKRSIDSSTGTMSAGSIWTLDPAPATPVYASAREILEKKVNVGTHTVRKIFTYNPGGQSATGAGDNLKFFLWANLSATEKDYFKKPNIAGLSQFCASGTTCLDATTQLLATEENLVNFLRGEKVNEGPLSELGKYFRQRTGLLGDIVGSEAVYVQKPIWNYADYGYGTFKSAKADRTAMVYVGANDGMLHAFNATSGSEEWAYIPQIVMPKIYKLADKSYAALHTFTVDGTPSYGDICASDCAAPPTGTGAPVWKTIMVGGLNNGGRGYYALDITNPAAPKALWEFTHDDLGYSFGNPVITKLKDGTWAVIVTSGYNNVTPGDGKGHLFILNANTGALIRSISTGAGSTTSPSGLSRIAAWANFPDNNNTAQRVYGGDLLGNLWRFDVNGDIPVESPVVYHAQRIATLKDASGVAQPITSKPELGKVKGLPVVFVGTGQLLGSDDLESTRTQSLYAIKDRLSGSADDYGSPRPLSPAQASPTPGDFVVQTMTAGTCPTGNDFCTAGDVVITSTSTAVDFSTKDGWYTDFAVAGERVNTDIKLQLGTIAFNTNTPKSGACVPVGVSFAYFLDYRNGGAVPGTVGLSGVKLGDYLAAAPSVIRMVDGTIKEIIRTDKPGTLIKNVPIAATPFATRRVSWRELLTEQ